MNYHKTVEQIKNLLLENNVWFETFEHQPVMTSQEAAKVRTGYTLNQGAKAIIIRVKESEAKKYFAMLVIPGDLRFKTDKVKAFFSAKDIRFATEEEVEKITDGVLPGGVPPFGNLFGLEVVVDPSLFTNDKIIFNAGDRGFSIAMKSTDYKKILDPKIISVV